MRLFFAPIGALVTWAFWTHAKLGAKFFPGSPAPDFTEFVGLFCILACVAITVFPKTTVTK